VGHPVGDAPLDAAVADLDRDGRNDLVVANSGASNNLSILLGQGNGVLAPADPLPVGTPAGAPQSVVVRDLNADGYSDLAVADTAAAKVSVFFAIPPRVDVSPTGVDFGSVELGGSTSRTITITNLGPQTVSIAVEPQITGRDQLDFEVKDWSCARNIAPDSSCTFSVAFRPGDRGSRIGSLRFRTSGIGAPDFIPLTGVATVPAVTFAQPLPNAQSVLGARSAAKSCRVPKLKGKTLGSARKLLKKARCKLGKVKKARISKKAKARIKAKVRSKHYKATTVVYKQSPKAKKRVKQNAKVTVTVRTKLKKVRKSARKR
jgi:hypothetical protein